MPTVEGNNDSQYLYDAFRSLTPGTDSEEGVSVQQDNKNVQRNYLKGDVTKLDSVSQADIAALQNLHLTGSVHASSAASPLIDPPNTEMMQKSGSFLSLLQLPEGMSADQLDPSELKEQILDFQTDLMMSEMGFTRNQTIKGDGNDNDQQFSFPPEDPGQQLKSNPWFNTSFLAVFTSIMNELLNYERETHYLEAQTELKARENIIAISTTQSELTKMIANAEAQAKMVEAIMSFAQAGMAVFSLAQTWGNAATARKEATAQIKEDKIATQDKIDALNAERQQIQDAPLNERYHAVATDPNSNALTSPPRALTPAENARIKEINTQIKVEQESLARMDTRDYMRSTVNTKQQHLDQQTQLKQQVMSNVINGIGQTIQASIIAHKGELEALKTMNDGYLQVLNKYADASAKSRDDAQADYDKALDFLNKIVDATYRAHSIGQSA